MVFVQLLFPIWHFNGVGDHSKKFRKTGPDRKKLDRLNARQQPIIKFKDSGFWTGKMLKKKIKQVNISSDQELFFCENNIKFS